MKNRNTFLKKILGQWGGAAGLVCVCLAVSLFLTGCPGDVESTNSSVPGVTDGTQTPSIDPTDTLPDESTGATDPTESTGGADPTDPTETVEPTDPSETPPPETEPVTEPSTESEDTWIPTEDPNAKPTEGESFDFGNATPDNLTYEEWSTWSWEKQGAFLGPNGYKGGMSKWTDEEYHNFACMENNNYDCGYEGHWCVNDRDHAYAMAQINKGCEHCGKHDCPSLFSHGTDGSWYYDHTLCPEYDVKKDETMYCVRCGLPKWRQAKSGEYYCTSCIEDAAYWPCDICGEKVYPGQCHNIHKKP